MNNRSKNTALIDSLLKYAVQNLNNAIDVLNGLREDYDDDDEFYGDIMESSSINMDEFILDMVTSAPYLQTTIEAIEDRGYTIEEDEEDEDELNLSHSNENQVEDLVNRLGKKRVVEMVMDL